MFHNNTHIHFLKTSKSFTEKSLSANGMVCIAMGTASKSFIDLCNETLDEIQLQTLVQSIQSKVKSKIWSLELEYCVHDGKKKHGFGHGIV